MTDSQSIKAIKCGAQIDDPHDSPGLAKTLWGDTAECVLALRHLDVLLRSGQFETATSWADRIAPGVTWFGSLTSTV